MNFWIGIFLASVCLVSAIAVLATKTGFPNHRVIAIVIYGIGWIPFLYSIMLRKQWLLSHHTAATNFLAAFWVHILFGVVMFSVVYVFLVLFPPVKSVFIGMDDSEIDTVLSEDATIIAYLDERLTGLIEDENIARLANMDFTTLSGDEKNELREFWISYVEVLLELDLLKERYKTFYQINVALKPELHARAFMNGYTAFLAQHNYVLRLTSEFTDPYIVSFLNDEIQEQGIPMNTFASLEDKLTDSDELLRLNTGRAYRAVLGDSGTVLDAISARYLENVDESIPEYTKQVAKKPLDFLERNAYAFWFPIQKKSALSLSYVRTTNRAYHINPEQIEQYQARLKPGDIIVERREWHATNVGIPGFWTHAALYIGSLSYLEQYFEGLPELEGKSFSSYLLEAFPDAYKKFTTLDEDGFQYSIIESKRPGVVMMSLEASTNADSVGIMRAKGLSKSDQLKVVMQAFSHLGKPYDYDFNFVTDTALVCSEVVYKAYQDIPQLTINPVEFNGRPIFSPNQFVEKFALEYGTDEQELELVLFLDGNEREKSATEASEELFATSWQRPKWHIAYDFVVSASE